MAKQAKMTTKEALDLSSLNSSAVSMSCSGQTASCSGEGSVKINWFQS
jgi:hypothetical protein